MKKKAIRLIIVFLFCVPPFYCISQQYNFQNYSLPEGLPHSQVSAMCQDSKGYIWFSTYGGGISRFDGKNFITYTEKDGLPYNLVRPIIEDKKGNLWLGTMGKGICKFDGKTFITINDSLISDNEKIYTILEDKKEVIWFGGDKGLYNFDGKQVNHFTLKEGMPEVPIMCVFQDSKGLVWIAAWEQGVYSYDGKTFKQYTQSDGLSYHTMMTITEDSKGNIWLGSFKGATKMVRNPGGEFSFYKSFSPDIDSSLVFAIVDDKRGNLWFGTSGKGLIKYEVAENSFTKINSNNGLPGDIILSMLQDREGNLWMSNWGFGVVKFPGEKFVHYTQKEGLGNDVINSMLSDGKGGMIVNCPKGIYKYTANGFQLLDQRLTGLTASAVHKDNKGFLWIGTSDALYRYDGVHFRKFTTTDGFAALPVTSITSNSNGIVFIGSWGNGLSSFDGANFKNYAVDDGLSSSSVYSVFNDSKDRICIGTWDGGLCVFDKNEFNVFNNEEGLNNTNVVSIAEDEKGNLWLGTFGGGIYRYDPASGDEGGGKNFLNISIKDGLSDDVVTALVFDSKQNLWIATSKGLNCLNTEEFNSTGKIKIRYYGKKEGFAGIECLNNAAYKDKDDNLWFGTKHGLSRYNAAADVINTVEPFTYITNLKLFFENTDWSNFSDSIEKSGLPAALKLEHYNNHLTFEFIGISFTVPEKVRYQYMLEDLDKDWSPVMDKTDATYSGLSPGSYSFKVRACNNDGLWNKSFASFDFTIKAPFWQTSWFYTLCILSLLGGIYSYVIIRTRKLENAKKVLEIKVTERTAEVVKKSNELEVAYKEIADKNIIVEQRNRDITDSVNYARRIQQAILPVEKEMKEALPDSFVLFKPRDIVSGDFYYFEHLKETTDSKILLAAVDCTGHGIPGAFMSMIGNTLLNEIIRDRSHTSPGKILDQLHEGVRQALKQNKEEAETRDGMDIAFCSLDQHEKMLRYAGAFRPLYIIRPAVVSSSETPAGEIRKYKLEEIKGDKFPIGGLQKEDSQSFTEQEIKLEKGNTFYLFTDGYADQFGGPKGKKFMGKRFQELLLSIQEKTMEEQGIILNETIEEWKGNSEQVDDILVIGVRV